MACEIEYNDSERIHIRNGDSESIEADIGPTGVTLDAWGSGWDAPACRALAEWLMRAVERMEKEGA